MKAAFKLACATKTWLSCQFFFLPLLSYCFCRTLHLPIGWNRSKPWNNKQSQEIKLRFNNRCGHRFPNMHLNLPIWCSGQAFKRVELNTALRSVEMSVFRQITATQRERTEAYGCLVWHTRGEYSVCFQFPKPDIRQVDVGRPPLGKTGGLSVRLDPSRLVEMFSLPLLLHSSKILGTLSFGNCFLKSAPVKVLRGCSRPSQSFVWVAAFYATAALRRCFGVGGFDSFPLSSTLGLRAEQLHLFSWSTV